MEQERQKRRTYRQSGFYSLRRALTEGVGLDGRTSEAKLLGAWRAAVEEALGGEPSALQRTALEAGAGTLRLLQRADAAIFAAGDRVVVGRGGRTRFIALVAERSRLVRELLDVLVKLPMLKGTAKPEPWPFWSEEEPEGDNAQEPAGATQPEATTEESSSSTPDHQTAAQRVGEAA